jgi:hypothetical protein
MAVRLLYSQKRTLVEEVAMSALCQKQTFCTAEKNIVCPHGTFDERAKLRSQLVVLRDYRSTDSEIEFGTGLVFSNSPNSGRITKKKAK